MTETNPETPAPSRSADPDPGIEEQARADAAIAVVAKRVIATDLRASIDRGSIDWGDYDEVGESDWDAIVARVHYVADQIDPTNEQYDEAYALLTERADSD
jgi:hypothetical protein